MFLPDKRHLDAAADFRQAASAEDLWSRLNRHLSAFGITGSIYGTEAFPDISRKIGFLVYDTIGSDWLNAKVDSDLFYSDEYVRAAREEADPILWSDTSRLEIITPEARRSLALDYDFGITSGVSMPMPFGNGQGASSIGCHAADMSFAEFDRIWLENSQAILGIVNAFDVHLRQDHIGDVFPLSPRERECLLWLAAGLRPQQVAHRLGTHCKTVEKQIDSARRKLKATSVAQAIATALVFGLITP